MELAKRWVGAAAIGAALLIGLSAPSAQAAYVVDLTQQGSDVVATGSGTIDLTDLSFDTALVFGNPGIGPGTSVILIGVTGTAFVDIYTGATGPGSFGSGGFTAESSGSGDLVGVSYGGTIPLVLVPIGYVSGSALSDTATWDNQTFSSLDVTPGTYKWTWGSGANADSFTLNIGAAAVLEPSTWAMMLLGFAGLAFTGFRSPRKRLAT